MCQRKIKRLAPVWAQSVRCTHLRRNCSLAHQPNEIHEPSRNKSRTMTAKLTTIGASSWDTNLSEAIHLTSLFHRVTAYTLILHRRSWLAVEMIFDVAQHVDLRGQDTVHGRYHQPDQDFKPGGSHSTPPFLSAIDTTIGDQKTALAAVTISRGVSQEWATKKARALWCSARAPRLSGDHREEESWMRSPRKRLPARYQPFGLVLTKMVWFL